MFIYENVFMIENSFYDCFFLCYALRFNAIENDTIVKREKRFQKIFKYLLDSLMALDVKILTNLSCVMDAAHNARRETITEFMAEQSTPSTI